MALRLRKDDSVLVRTPVMPPDRNSSDAKLDVLLDPDGDAQFTARALIKGGNAAFLRQELEAQNSRRERFANSLATQYPGARLGDLRIQSLKDISEPLRYNYTAFIPTFAKRTGDTLEIPLDHGAFLVARYGRLPERRYDLIVGAPMEASRKVVLSSPAAFEISEVPSNTRIETKFGSLKLDVIVDGGQIIIQRFMEIKSHRVAAGDYADFVNFCRQVDEAMSARIVLRRPQ